MKKVYYLQKHEVKLGDVIEYGGIRTILTEELIELNPELFKIEEDFSMDLWAYIPSIKKEPFKLGTQPMYIKKHKEKTLEDYEQMLFKKDSSMTFSPKSAYFSVYGWIKDNEPKLYYTKILQLIADDLHGGRHTHIYMNTSYHINNTYGVNVHCGYDEGCVYFRSNELAIKAIDILGGEIKYLFNQA